MCGARSKLEIFGLQLGRSIDDVDALKGETRVTGHTSERWRKERKAECSQGDFVDHHNRDSAELSNEPGDHAARSALIAKFPPDATRLDLVSPESRGVAYRC